MQALQKKLFHKCVDDQTLNDLAAILKIQPSELQGTPEEFDKLREELSPKQLKQWFGAVAAYDFNRHAQEFCKALKDGSVLQSTNAPATLTLNIHATPFRSSRAMLYHPIMREFVALSQGLFRVYASSARPLLSNTEEFVDNEKRLQTTNWINACSPHEKPTYDVMNPIRFLYGFMGAQQGGAIEQYIPKDEAKVDIAATSNALGMLFPRSCLRQLPVHMDVNSLPGAITTTSATGCLPLQAKEERKTDAEAVYLGIQDEALPPDYEKVSLPQIHDAMIVVRTHPIIMCPKLSKAFTSSGMKRYISSEIAKVVKVSTTN
jgi:hypothetical protein